MLTENKKNYPSPQAKRGRSLEISLQFALKMVSVLPSVTSISSHSFEVRGLKFGMHNPHMNGSNIEKSMYLSKVRLRAKMNAISRRENVTFFTHCLSWRKVCLIL